MIRFLTLAAFLIASASAGGWALAKIQSEPEISNPVAAIEHLLALPTCEIHRREAQVALSRDQIERRMDARRAGLETAIPGLVKATPVRGPATAFPIQLTAKFDLIDQTGTRRTEADFQGQTYALFFGYASCEAICSAVLPDIANAMDLLEAEGLSAEAVMISVDPARDTPSAMRDNLEKWHSRIIGLTGAPDALKMARDHFQVEVTKVGEDQDGAAIYAHGSMIYLIGPDGSLQTILPPVFSPDHLARIIRGYIKKTGET